MQSVITAAITTNIENRRWRQHDETESRPCRPHGEDIVFQSQVVAIFCVAARQRRDVLCDLCSSQPSATSTNCKVYLNSKRIDTDIKSLRRLTMQRWKLARNTDTVDAHAGTSNVESLQCSRFVSKCFNAPISVRAFSASLPSLTQCTVTVWW